MLARQMAAILEGDADSHLRVKLTLRAERAEGRALPRAMLEPPASAPAAAALGAQMRDRLIK